MAASAYCGAMSDRTTSLAGTRIIVVGAGVLGLATAAVLAGRGAAVRVVDPDLGAGSASAAAAGMIAPAMEAALEDGGVDRAALYRAAAALWPGFARRAGIDLIAEGADWLGPREPVASRLQACGFPVEPHADRLHIPGEARVDVGEALGRLRAELGEGALSAERVERIDRGSTGPSVVVGGQSVLADAVVLAAGWSAGDVPVDGLPALRRLIAPVKGQIIALSGPGVASVQRMTRGPGIYLLPGGGGVIAGATLEVSSATRLGMSSRLSRSGGSLTTNALMRLRKSRFMPCSSRSDLLVARITRTSISISEHCPLGGCPRRLTTFSSMGCIKRS